MKNQVKIISIVISFMLILTFLVSCGKSYIDTVSSSDLANTAISSFVTEGGTRVLDDDVILSFTDEELSYLRDYTVIKAKASKNINEIGIFRVEDGKASDFKSFVDTYVSDTQRSYRSMNYFPEEIEKIDCATVKVYGNYVIYSFLNEADTEAFYAAIENVITE